MLLVPRQLQRVGMTGAVPYYGGRFTPAQAYGAAHPTAPPLSFADPMTGGAFVRAPVPTPIQPAPPGSPMPGQAAPSGSPMPGQAAPSGSAVPSQADTEVALQHLLNTGVISQVEFQVLRARVTR